MESSFQACPGCGAVTSLVAGPAHRYMGASPGCWARFGEVLAREYSDPAYAGVHRITVDAYAAQHPGKPSPRSIQSVAVHLLGLYWALEKQLPLAEVTQRIGRAVRAGKHYGHFRWLEPPFPLGAVTVFDVAEAQSPQTHAVLVKKWAHVVWLAWAPHHNQIRNWAAVSEAWK